MNLMAASLQTHLFIIYFWTISFISAGKLSCKENTLPYRARVLNGRMLSLDCTALPDCFTNTANLIRQKVDVHSTDRSLLEEPSYESNKAVCQRTTWPTSCTTLGGWFAGSTSLPHTKKCCQSNALTEYKIIRQKLLHSGKTYNGGLHRINNSHLAFDFISDASKIQIGTKYKYLILAARAICASEQLNDPSQERGNVPLVSKHASEQSTSQVIKEPKKPSATNENEREETAFSNEAEEEVEEKDSKNNSTITPDPLKKEHNTGESSTDDSGGCFTSPSGHRCCSRDVLKVLNEMELALSNELDRDANNTTIMKAMIRYIEKETRKKFCTPFETIISRGEFASKSHTNGTAEQDGVALGCKTQVRIPSISRFRRQAGDLIEEANVFNVLTYSTVINANSQNSKAITFPNFPEPPPPPPPSSSNAANANSQSAANANSQSAANANSQSAGNANSQGSANAFDNFAAPAPAPQPPPPPPPPPQPPSPLEQCFSEDGIVETDNGVKSMRDLVIGDNVLASTNKKMLTFSPVVTFLHRKPSEPALFYHIEADNGAKMKLTGKHIMYVTDCISEKYQRIYAEQAKVGHCVPWIDSEKKLIKSTSIVNITTAWQTGIYSPLTETGTIVVNNILASCHSTVAAQHRLQQSYFDALQTFDSWINWVLEGFHYYTTKRMEKDEIEAVFGSRFFSSVFDAIVPQRIAIAQS